MTTSPLAGKPVPNELLIDVTKLLDQYYQLHPDPSEPTQRVQFGTSGHRGSSANASFNENHILAITQAIVEYRREQGITGPLFIGMDTHALSAPAQKTALEVLAAHGVETMLARDDGYTPTPVISHAILTYNRGRSAGMADGIVITPSHNPPSDGGFKYNPPNGGPADVDVTNWVEKRANQLLGRKAEWRQTRTLRSSPESPHHPPIRLHQPLCQRPQRSRRYGVDSLGGLTHCRRPSGRLQLAYWEPISRFMAST